MSIKNYKLCVFCGEKPASTMDHVPPDCLFPEPKPSNLITVPACKNCNLGSSKDDEYFRAIITVADGNNEIAAQLVTQKIIPRFRKKPALLQSIMKSSKKVSVYSEGGIYLGKSPAIPYEPQRIHLVLEKIVRGFFWHETKTILGTDYCVKRFIFNPQFADQAKRGIAALPLRIIGDGKVFSYRYLLDENNKKLSCWWLMFFDASLFMLMTEPKTNSQKQ
jgi:hypothetical protein